MHAARSHPEKTLVGVPPLGLRSAEVRGVSDADPDGRVERERHRHRRCVLQGRGVSATFSVGRKSALEPEQLPVATCM